MRLDLPTPLRSAALMAVVSALVCAVPVTFAQAPTDALDLAIAGSDDHVYAWFADGTVSSGSSGRLDRYRTPYRFTLPSGRQVSDVQGIGIAGSDDHVYVWYKDGTVSSGTSRDLDAYRGRYAYSLPPQKTPADIVAVGIAGSDDHVYVWYKDGTVSSGTSSDLDAYRAPKPYSLPPGRSVRDLVGIGIAGSDDHVYAWYKDGTVSSGTSTNLDAYRAPYPYHQHLLLKAWWGPDPRRAVGPGPRADVLPFRDGLSPKEEGMTRVPFPSVPRGASEEVTWATDDLTFTEAFASDQSPPPLGKPFEAGIQGVDPMVAVGRKYVLVSQQTAIRFLDRSGNALPEKDGIGPKVSGNQLFAAFLDPDSPTDVNRYAGFPEPCDGPSYPDAYFGRKFCIAQAYDLRVFFDAVANRFLVLANMRNPVWTKAFRTSVAPGQRCGYWRNPSWDVMPLKWSRDPGNWCRLARRQFALAVSKTEDPRDGFHLYAVTENNYRDFPWATLNGDSLVIANRGREMPDGPVATVLSLEALRKGAQRVPYFRYYRDDLGGHTGVLLPVHHGSPGGLTLMYARGSGKIRVFGFPPPTRPYAKPPLVSVLVDVEPLWPAVFRDDFLYLADQRDTKQSPNSVSRMNIKMARVPLWAEGSGPAAKLKTSKRPEDGFVVKSFGKRGPGDAEEDIVSYEMPNLAVTKNGDVVFGYARFPVATQDPLFPEVRYTVWYHDESTQRRSNVLKKGTVARSQPPRKHLDYTWAVVDPVDDATVWIAHDYSGSNGYRTVVGKVRP